MTSRQERSIEVEETYRIVYGGCQMWTVQHPQEEDRCYLVQMIERRCSCPDWCCTASGLGIDCKHIIAIGNEWEKLTGLKYRQQIRDECDPKLLIADCYHDQDGNEIDPFERI